MHDDLWNGRGPIATTAPPQPEVTDRATWQARLDGLLVREKAHTREGTLVCYLRDDDRVFETYWTTGRATEAMGSVYGLLDMTVYGRQETFEDSTPGWPQFWRNNGEQWRVNGRPTVQWPWLAVGRSDDLGVTSTLSG
jgi:predicted dithiol-disulfide oxidoreductase (DUF899 family)